MVFLLCATARNSILKNRFLPSIVPRASFALTGRGTYCSNPKLYHFSSDGRSILTCYLVSDQGDRYHSRCEGIFVSTRSFATSSSSKNDDSEKEIKATSKDNPSEKVDLKKIEKEVKSSPSLLPGLGLAAGTAFGGFSMASALTALTAVPVSGIPVSILLGMTLRNYTPIFKDEENAKKFQPGMTTATKTVLQTGIVCVAAKLSFVDVLSTGTASIPVVLGAVTSGMLWIPFAGQHLAGLSPELSRLLAAGTSICGVTAITALAPAIKAPPKDVAVAVANTVAFGTAGMLLYPYLFHVATNLPSEQIGMCLGVAIHDTSQVLGAALSYKETYNDEVAFQVAAVTKLLRNLGLAVAIPLLTYTHHKELTSAHPASSSESNPSTISGLNTFSKYVPPFLIAFLGMSAFRSGGDLLIASSDLGSTAELYTQCMNFIGNDCSKYALGTAMAGVGLSTKAESLRGVGWKPFAVGLSGALVVGGTGFTIATMMV